MHQPQFRLLHGIVHLFHDLRGLFVFIGVVGILGVAGHMQYFAQADAAHPLTEGTWADAVFRTIQLFVLGAGYPPGPKPVLLELARFVAPLALLWAALATVSRALGEHTRLANAQRHSIVVGVGLRGMEQVRHRRDARDSLVVVIETDPSNEWLAVCRKLGAIVLEGDGTQAEMLRLARVDYAARVYFTTHDDAANLDGALQAVRLWQERPRHPGAITIAASVTDPLLRDVPERIHVPGTPRVQTLNRWADTARRLLDEHPLDHRPIRPESAERVHLIVIGFGFMARELVLQALHQGSYANGKPLHVTVVDPDAGKETSFRARFPSLDDIAVVRFWQGSMEDPDIRTRLEAEVAEPNTIPTVAICEESRAETLTQLHLLPASLQDPAIPILVEFSGDPQLVNPSTGVHPFRIDRDDSRVAERIDRLACAHHWHYLMHRATDPNRSSDPDDPALRSWDELPERYRWSNRHLADHTPVKLRAIGCTLVDADANAAPSAALTEAEVERLAHMEHQRWVNERRLSGWQLDDEGSPNARSSPHLGPYDELPATIQEYDRRIIRDLPNILAKADPSARIVRNPIDPEGGAPQSSEPQNAGSEM